MSYDYSKRPTRRGTDESRGTVYEIVAVPIAKVTERAFADILKKNRCTLSGIDDWSEARIEAKRISEIGGVQETTIMMIRTTVKRMASETYVNGEFKNMGNKGAKS